MEKLASDQSLFLNLSLESRPGRFIESLNSNKQLSIEENLLRHSDVINKIPSDLKSYAPVEVKNTEVSARA